MFYDCCDSDIVLDGRPQVNLDSVVCDVNSGKLIVYEDTVGSRYRFPELLLRYRDDKMNVEDQNILIDFASTSADQYYKETGRYHSVLTKRILISDFGPTLFSLGSCHFYYYCALKMY